MEATCGMGCQGFLKERHLALFRNLWYVHKKGLCGFMSGCAIFIGVRMN